MSPDNERGLVSAADASLSWRRPGRSMLHRVILVALALPLFAATVRATEIRDVKHRPGALDPTRGETVAVSFTLSEPAMVALDIYDGRDLWIRRVESSEMLGPGRNVLHWNGADEAGRFVPPEAYHYTLTAVPEGSAPVTWDVTDVSEKPRNTASGVSWDAGAQEIRYDLPHPARVNIRIGLKDGGPLLATLIDWVPRTAGSHREEWDGFDTAGLLFVGDHPRLDIGVNTFELSPNSIIVLPESNDVRLIEDIPWEERRRTPTRTVSKRMYDHLHQPIELRRDYALLLDVAQGQREAGGDETALSGKTEIRIDLPPEERLRAQNERFEIVVYVDGHFVWESETAYLPMTYVWDPQGPSRGVHYITVNLCGYEGHFGTNTVKIAHEPQQ